MSETATRPIPDIIQQLSEHGLEGLRPRLLREPPPLAPHHGDYDLNPATKPTEARKLTPAAVLLPIVARREPTILFTQRTETLSKHAGQVSFPGGRADDTDVSLVQTALRETQEETGIDPAFVTVAGFLDSYETGTGYAILPVVGMLTEGFALNPHADEVAEIFEVPIAWLLEEANKEIGEREWQGRMRRYHAWRYEGHYIWGATAAMLVNFNERLRR
ncbi:MAG TPA: CoA pyrophosphatase [Rhizomicrobium sp.]|jgi:8-oxo-dGTP pyrophosphatase MutT (NUDIX family)|nr:CoA pyrophosphatase [Rhizomicrobium sp.]